MLRSVLCAAFVLGLIGNAMGAKPVPVTRPAPDPAKEGEVVKVNEKSGKLTIKVDGKEQEFVVGETAQLLDAKGEKLKSLTDVKGPVKFWLAKDNSISKLQLVK